MVNFTYRYHIYFLKLKQYLAYSKYSINAIIIIDKIISLFTVKNIAIYFFIFQIGGNFEIIVLLLFSSYFHFSQRKAFGQCSMCIWSKVYSEILELCICQLGQLYFYTFPIYFVYEFFVNGRVLLKFSLWYRFVYFLLVLCSFTVFSKAVHWVWGFRIFYLSH